MKKIAILSLLILFPLFLFAKVDINTATLKQLTSLNGIGKGTAKKIIDHRKKSPFKTVKDLMKVKGIGKGKFNKIKDDICINCKTEIVKKGKTTKKKTTKKKNCKKGKASTSNLKININTASLKELTKLNGIGKGTAKKIVDHRKKSPFKTIKDIMKVKGIGKGKFNKIKDNIVVK